MLIDNGIFYFQKMRSPIIKLSFQTKKTKYYAIFKKHWFYKKYKEKL